MIYISSVWTYVSYKKMFRNVETEISDKNGHYNLIDTSKNTIFNVLMYDILFEIGIAYVTFYNLFIIHLPILHKS
jgi:hypothetical protein